VALQLIRVSVKPDHTSDVEDAVGKVFEELDAIQPEGLRYTSLRSADSTYVIILDVADGTENPLPEIPAFREFQASLPSWLAGPPVVDNLTVVGSYRF